MKKTLLALFTLFCGATASYAADIVADFTGLESTTTDDRGIDKTVVTGEGDSQLTWNLPPKTYITAHYLFITSKAEVNTTVPIKVAKIQLMTSTSCSETATNTISIKVGENEFVTGEKVNARGQLYEFLVPADVRTTDGVYTFSAPGAKNPQFTKIIFVEETADPTLSIAEEELSFASVLNGTSSQTLKIIAENVTGSISLSVDNADFTVPATVTPAAAAEGVEIVYTGKTAGEATATLTVKAASLTATVALKTLTVAHEGTEESPLTIQDVLALNNVNIGPFCVTGKITKYCGANAKDGILGTTETLVASNIVLEDEEANLMAVALPAGTTRNRLNIVDNPDNVGLTIIVKGTLEQYFGAPGVKNTEYVSGLPEVEAAKVADIAAFIEKADKTAPCIIEGDVTVIYANGKSLYVQDASGRLCVYGIDWTYEPGDVIPGGFQGTFQEYNGLPQMSEPSGFEAATKGEAPAAEVVTLTDVTIADAYKLVTVDNVKVAVNGKNLTLTSGDATLPAYNTFNITLPEVSEEASYTVTGIVGAYQGNAQILVTEIALSDGSGICSIAADENAPAEYFNIQGQRIDNPTPGLYIIRKGGKVAKVIVR